MSYIILTRNPNSNKIAIITNYNPDDDSDYWIAEFNSIEQAETVADTNILCSNYGYQVVEMEI